MAARMIHIKWSIKGYHVYRVRPHPQILLKIVPEPQNRFDPNAFVVEMPGLNEIPRYLHDTETRERQNVRSIAGCQVGHLPANLGIGTFKRRIRRDRPGGGPELRCSYSLSVCARNVRNSMIVFEQCLTRTKLDEHFFC
ncbi:hypothetical protein ACF0H5_000660 [Mactra antiquata]